VRPAERCVGDDRARELLAERVGRGRFDRFFSGGVRLTLDGAALRIEAPSAFHRDWLRRRFSTDAHAVAEAELGESARVQWSIRAMDGDAMRVESTPERSDPAPERAAPAAAAPRRATGGPAMCVSGYEVSEENRLAVAAARSIALDEDLGFRVLTVYGGCGVGKSRLMRLVTTLAGEGGRARRVETLTGERFVEEYVGSVKRGAVDAFRRRRREVDILCIDDVQDLAGKRSTQQELVHTIDTLTAFGSRVVLMMDRAPGRAERLLPQLRSRLMAGMVVELRAPGVEEKTRIAERLAAERGLRLDGGVAELLARRSPSGVRELEGAVARVEACVRLLGLGDGAVDERIAARALGLGAVRAPRRPLRFERILEAVCDRVGVEMSDVLGRGKHARVVVARGLVCALARDLTTLSYPEIARRLNRKNHSTVITARDRLLGQVERGETAPRGAGRGDVTLAALRDELARVLTAEG